MFERWAFAADWEVDDDTINTSGIRPSEVFEEHRAAIRRIVLKNNAQNPRVFGSVLHGTDTIESDLDMIVDAAGRLSLLDIGAIRVALRDLLGVPVDGVTPGSLPEKFLTTRNFRGSGGMTDYRLPDYLEHILEAASKIDDFVASLEYGEFVDDVKTRDAAIRNIEVIGEASNRISKRYPELNIAHPELSIDAAVGMRNAVIHGYMDVNIEDVFEVATVDIPELIEIVCKLRNDLDRELPIID